MLESPDGRSGARSVRRPCVALGCLAIVVLRGAERVQRIAKRPPSIVRQLSEQCAECLFAYCAGIEDRGATTVQIIKADAVVWSYSVNKGRGQKNRQALAEAIAKHMKADYFHDK